MNDRASVVAVLGGEVVGFSDDDRSGHVDMLFVSPKHSRRGTAKTLLRSTRKMLSSQVDIR